MASDCATPSDVVRPAPSVTGMAANWCLNDAEPYASVLLDLLLQVRGELLVTLGSDNRQCIHIEATNALACSGIDADPQATTDSLPALALCSNLTDSADLKHVWVIPSLAQGRVRENKLQLSLEAQQLLLVLHNEVIGTFRIIAVALSAVSVHAPFLSMEK